MNPLEYQAGEPTPALTTHVGFWARYKQLLSRISKQNRPSVLTDLNRRSSATLACTAIMLHAWPGSEYCDAGLEVAALFAFLNNGKKSPQTGSEEKVFHPQIPCRVATYCPIVGVWQPAVQTNKKDFLCPHLCSKAAKLPFADGVQG